MSQTPTANCPNCGAPLEGSPIRCSYCGTRLSNVAPKSDDKDQPPTDRRFVAKVAGLVAALILLPFFMRFIPPPLRIIAQVGLMLAIAYVVMHRRRR